MDRKRRAVKQYRSTYSITAAVQHDSPPQPSSCERMINVSTYQPMDQGKLWAGLFGAGMVPAWRCNNFQREQNFGGVSRTGGIDYDVDYNNNTI